MPIFGPSCRVLGYHAAVSVRSLFIINDIFKKSTVLTNKLWFFSQHQQCRVVTCRLTSSVQWS